ncbi:MAG TPA: hypothetical protein EYP62_06975 [Kiritimatiellae bacterium]|nr:hypothetical protein [Kiritimatiellia bacterium]
MKRSGLENIAGGDLLEQSRDFLRRLVRGKGLAGAQISVQVGVLSPEEVIGRPARQDFPLLVGREVMVEARLGDARGQVFTNAPAEYSGTVSEIIALDLCNRGNRAIFAATLNAVLRACGLIEGTVHCRNEEPELCAAELARRVMHDGIAKVGLVGLQPAFLEALATALGPERVRVTDLDPRNIGTLRQGIEVWDGQSRYGELAEWADLLVVTGSSVVSGSFAPLAAEIQRLKRRFVLYGVSAAAACRIFGLPRFCVFGH